MMAASPMGRILAALPLDHVVSVMSNPLERSLAAAMGLTALTKASAEKVVAQLVKSGEIATSQMPETVQDLIEKSKENRQLLIGMIQNEVQRNIRTMGLAGDDDVEDLRRQIQDLQRQVSTLQQPAAEDGT